MTICLLAIAAWAWAPAAQAALRRCESKPIPIGGRSFPSKVTAIAVSGVSCPTAIRVIRKLYSTRTPTPIVDGFTITPFRSRGHVAHSYVLHARKGRQNFYFRVALPPQPEFLTLVQAIPVNREVGKARLISVELFTDGMKVRWAVRGPLRLPRGGNPIEESREFVAVTLRDDVGTRYGLGESGWSGSEDLLTGEGAFGAPVPPRATRLFITIKTPPPANRLALFSLSLQAPGEVMQQQP